MYLVQEDEVFWKISNQLSHWKWIFLLIISNRNGFFFVQKCPEPLIFIRFLIFNFNIKVH